MQVQWWEAEKGTGAAAGGGDITGNALSTWWNKYIKIFKIIIWQNFLVSQLMTLLNSQNP
jgi:hypothetical protein